MPGATTSNYNQTSYEDTVGSVKKNTYVDNLMKTVSSVTELKCFKGYGNFRGCPVYE